MIISNDRKSWVLSTPTKVGSTAIEYDLVKRYGIGVRLSQEEACGSILIPDHGKRYQHGAICNLKVKERLLLVRHPLERFTSIYFFCIKKGCWHMSKYSRGPNLFCEKFIEFQNEHWIEIEMLDSYYKLFRPTKILKLESGLERFKHFGIAATKESHSNSNPHETWSMFSRMIDPALRKRIVELHDPAIRILGY